MHTNAEALDGVALDRKLVVGGAAGGQAFRRFLFSIRYATAERDADAIRAALDGPEAVVVGAALGDPAGSGAAPLVARVAAASDPGPTRLARSVLFAGRLARLAL